MDDWPTDRTEPQEVDPRRYLAREADSAMVLDSVRAALRVTTPRSACSCIGRTLGAESPLR